MGIRQLVDFFDVDREYVRLPTIGSEHTAELLDASGQHRLSRIHRMTPNEACALLEFLAGFCPEHLDTAWRNQDEMTAK